MKFSSRKQTWLCLCSLLLSGSCLAAKERPTIGLALSGGGVKGFSQIGVLKVFEEIGLPIDYISGSSMGSVVGGLYAIGYTAGELEELVVITDWDEIFSDNLGRRSFAMNQKLWDERTILTLPIHSGRIAVPSGLRSGQKVSRLLSRLTLSAHGIDDFTNFPIPFVCLATDIETGEGVPLDSGILAEAIRASMAIPSVFTPVEIDGRRLVDGGEVRTVPVDDVLRFHPDIVIGVDATSRLYEKEQLSSLMTIYDQTMRFRKVQSNIEQLSKADLVIRPDFKGLSMTDYKQGKTFIERGERAARAILPELQALVDSLGVRSNNYKIRIKPQVPDFFFIVNIEIVGARASSENLILKELDIQVPALYTLQEIEGTVDRMYSLQLFERVVYAIQPDSIGSKLYIKVTESNLDEFRFGLRYDSTNDAAVLLNTLFRNVIFQNALLNLDLKLGRQVRFDGQFLVPIGLIPSFALRARVNYFDDLIAIFVGQNREARFDVKSTFFEGLVGNFFSSQINVAGGFRSEYINSNSNIASPAIADSLALSQSTLSFLYQI
ncbi:MAG TPA: patatin-like phospholipase family protein, partial [bacterium]